MSSINRFTTAGAAPVFLVAAVALWSGNFIAARWIGDGIDAVGLNFWRWSIALLVLAPLSFRQCRRNASIIRASWPHLALLGLTGVAVFHVCVYQSLRHTTATNALLMLSTAPALIMVLSRVFLAEVVSKRQWYGVALSFAGAAVLVCRGDMSTLRELGFGTGEAWMLVAVPAWAVYSVLLKRRPAGLPQEATLTASSLAGIVWMTPLVLYSPSTLFIDWTPTLSAAVGYIAVGASVVAFLGWNRGVALVGPARAGVFLHLMPLIGTLLAVIVLGEKPHGYHIAGGMLVFGGICLGQCGMRRWRKRLGDGFSRTAS